jgi:hypothetical protein
VLALCARAGCCTLLRAVEHLPALGVVDHFDRVPGAADLRSVGQFRELRHQR